MTTQNCTAAKVDMEMVREVFRLGRQFEDAVRRLEDAIDETVCNGRVLSVLRTDADSSIDTSELDDLSLCLRLGNCIEDSWGGN